MYNAVTPDDRELFLTCNRSLSPERLNTVTEEAVEWLSAKSHGDRTAFLDEVLGDKVDALIFEEGFGPEQQKASKHLFEYFHGEQYHPDLVRFLLNSRSHCTNKIQVVLSRAPTYESYLMNYMKSNDRLSNHLSL